MSRMAWFIAFKLTPQGGRDYQALPQTETKETGVLLSSSFLNNLTVLSLWKHLATSE